MVAEHPGFHFQRCVLTQPQHIQLVFAYINANKCHLSIPPLVYAASSRLGRARIPYRLRERSEPDLRRRVIALRSATGFRLTKVLVANQHSGRDTRSTAPGAKGEARIPSRPLFAPGAGAPTGEARVDCRSTALGAKGEARIPSRPLFVPGAGAPTQEARADCRSTAPGAKGEARTPSRPLFAPWAGAPTQAARA